MYQTGQKVIITARPDHTHFLTIGSVGVLTCTEVSSINTMFGIEGINDAGYPVYQVLSPDCFAPYFQVGDIVKIRKESEYYGIDPSNPADVHGEVTEVLDFGALPLRVSWGQFNYNGYSFEDLEYVDKTEVLEEEIPVDISKLKPITEMATTAQRNAVLITALEMLQSSTKITPEEVKNKLRKDEREYRWIQPVIETLLEDLTAKGLIAECKGGYCLKTTPTVGRSTKSITTKIGKAIKTVSKKAKPSFTKAVRISKTTALGLIKNNKGRFFTAVFEKKDGTVRTINCQYRKGQPASEFGYVQVNESGLLKTSPTKAIRQINMQTLKSLTIAGTRYVLNS